MLRRALLTGTLFALAAGLLWGLVFVVPTLLPDYPAVLLSCARYLAFGLIALPLAWFDRARIAELTRDDWREAFKLSAVGNLLYYLCLAGAIQRAGGPLPTMIIGTLPVVIAVASNLRRSPQVRKREGRLPWLRLLPSLLLIAAGIGCVNQVEIAALRVDPQADVARYAIGALLAIAQWPAGPGTRSAMPTGCARIPIGARARGPPHRAWRHCRWRRWASRCSGPGARRVARPSRMPFGPTPALFIGLMLAVGLLASWLGTLCWNEASQRLPTSLAGQLIVFETLAALAYVFMLRGQAPGPVTLAGIALLVAGVMWALRVRPEPLAVEGHAA